MVAELTEEEERDIERGVKLYLEHNLVDARTAARWASSMKRMGELKHLDKPSDVEDYLYENECGYLRCSISQIETYETYGSP